MDLIAQYHTIFHAESTAEMKHFSVILGDDGMIYFIILCKISPEVYHFINGHTQKYCNILESMNRCICSPSPYLPGWESRTSKSGIFVTFWQINLMDLAQCGPDKAGRWLSRHAPSYIGTQARFWDRSVAMDGSHSTIAYNFLHWRHCWNVAF